MKLFSPEYNQWLAREMRSRYGAEYTPGQIEEVARNILAKVRKAAAAKGLRTPGSDEELVRLIGVVMGRACKGEQHRNGQT